MTLLLLFVTAVCIFITYYTIKQHRKLKDKYRKEMERIEQNYSFNKSDRDALNSDFKEITKDFKTVGDDFKKVIKDFRKGLGL